MNFGWSLKTWRGGNENKIIKMENKHMKNSCAVKRNAYYGVKCVWVLKGTIANSQGPKNVWVPKI